MQMWRRYGLLFLIAACFMAFCGCEKDGNVENANLDNRQLVFGETRSYWEGFALTPEIKDWAQPVVFAQDGKWGFKNSKTGEIVVEPLYDNYHAFRNGIGAVRETVDGEFIWRQVDIYGNFLDYDQVSNFYAGTAIVEKDGKYGVINTQSQLIVPLVYDEIFPSYTYDENTKEEIRSTYGVQDGVWAQLNLADGYASVYEPVVEGKEYDSIFSLADHQILVVNHMLLVDGEPQSNSLDFPICALHNIAFDLYGQNEKIGRYTGKLVSGMYEGDVMITFPDYACDYYDFNDEEKEESAYLAVLASPQSPMVTVEKITDYQPYQNVVEDFLQAHHVENTEITFEKGVTGEFLQDGKIGALIEMSDAYRKPEGNLLEKASWQQADWEKEKVALVNAILYIPDIEHPSVYKEFIANVWQNFDVDYRSEHIYFITDLNGDNMAECVIDNHYYEYRDYAVKEIVLPLEMSHPAP